ncbi:Nitrogen assimilation transcription factor nit-4 [Fusarium culmorum]|uniref:Nitrogen assimilation transcription factor nit-4 n=1 Tax=Fusarium culmorum TaxID=5516 RepID=A0A2T4GDP1_FUSCU|nr:Nitrogen assimilation transcription factor nit-4 [Fusarium culmorum]
MTNPNKIVKRQSGRESKGSAGGALCKTCTPCRQKKVRCDGTRPQCVECSTNSLPCVYPHDARREPRPSRARVQSLEATVAAMLDHMKAAGILSPEMQSAWTAELMDADHPSRASQDYTTHGLSHLASTAAIASPLPTPTASTVAQDMSASFLSSPPRSSVGPTDGETKPRLDSFNTILSRASATQLDSAELAPVKSVPRPISNDGNGDGAGLSPSEARVAGVFHENGYVSAVHGLASIMNPTSRAQHRENINKMTRKGDDAISASKARLISNAALQRQREARMFRNPRDLMDLDGVDPELAKHLLDLHFNRQHYAYLISYRPAIMDSLASGGGPFANKLLLNAIFYSTSLYSDRACLRADPDDPQSVGRRFYDRFRELLIDELDKPSIPSALALLLTSVSLVSQGKPSAGWSLSGTAHRMIIDLGCHLMLGPDYESTGGVNEQRVLRTDLEQEMRKRLYWAAFTTDATQALYLGRPCMFASAQARVPLQLLDTFEELEEWEPYIDPKSPGSAPPPYGRQPAHAVSTFSSLVRLLQISTRINDLYGIQCVKYTTEYLLNKKESIEREFEKWQTSLPSHLRFDPDDNTTITPPPIKSPHSDTTFHALTILLHRAFLEEGHLRRHTDETMKRRGEEACIQSALMIQKVVRRYRESFTLRRAPFLLSYAVYSAVIVILRQERHERGQFTEPISFFWTCLSELQVGCNFGLKKPLSVLQDMVREFQTSIKESGSTGTEQPHPAGLDESFFFPLAMAPSSNTIAPNTSTPTGAYMSASASDYIPNMDHFDPTFGHSPGLLDFLNDQEKDISQDALYGLFAPSQPFP